ncbi:EF hand, partial [Trichuris suis]
MRSIAGSSLTLYESMYNEVNPSHQAYVGAQQAAAFLKRSNLSKQILIQIWNEADSNRTGSLDRTSFFAALKFVALVQHGKELLSTNLTLDVGAPVIVSSSFAFWHRDYVAALSLCALKTHRCRLHRKIIFRGVLRLEIYKQVSLANLSAPMLLQSEELKKYEDIFGSLNPVGGKLSGEQVKSVLFNSGLPVKVLGKIWELSDIDRDGYLDKDEMCLALHLVYRALENDPVPDTLSQNMIPPSKRGISRIHSSTLSTDS